MFVAIKEEAHLLASGEAAVWKFNSGSEEEGVAFEPFATMKGSSPARRPSIILLGSG
jgi:hypothetical protein